jgi:hypothetical protein
MIRMIGSNKRIVQIPPITVMARFTQATHLVVKIDETVATADPVTLTKCSCHRARWVACVKQAMTVEGEESELWLPSTLRNN